LRQKQREAFAQASRSKGQLRSTPVGFMKQTLDNLKLEKLLESPGMKEKLARAGYRGQGPLVTFMFFRFLMPPVVFIGAMIYVFGIAQSVLVLQHEIARRSRRCVDGLLRAGHFRQQSHSGAARFHHARLPRRPRPHADLRRVGDVDRVRLSTAWRRRWERSPSSSPRSWGSPPRSSPICRTVG